MAKKYVYLFSKEKNDGNGTMKDLLGGKGANLAEMAKIGLPVPAGITITTEACIEYYKNGEKVPKEVEDQMIEGLKELEKINGKKLGDKNDPLLVSVRSGAKMSMPGMMDTILNLGLNDESVEGLVKKTKNERFAWDSYRRFIAMYGDVVMGVEKSHFEQLIRAMKKNRKVSDDTQLTTDDLKLLVKEFKALYKKESGKDFPQEPLEQLRGARNAVFQSWNNPRAITYRRMYKIPDEIGTAVNVQTMVFGNKGDSSATGVAFTRNPSTGENEFFGEYLLNAQGEDVVAGIRTGKKIVDMGKELPKTYKELLQVRQILESNFKDVQDFEFTVEEGKLYMLQTRNGKRTGQAAVRIAVEMQQEGLIDKKQALKMVDPVLLEQLLHPMFDPKAKYEVLTKGTVGTPGAGTGVVVFDADEAVEVHEKQGVPVILVREETCPDDIHGMAVSNGVVTCVGGATAHAIVVGRQMGKACVCGCKEIHIDFKSKKMTVHGKTVKAGEWISVDGTKCEIVLGKVPLIIPENNKFYDTLMKWVDEFRTMEVWANADTPKDATLARQFGAQGIGLCRTEHMFFAEDRIPVVQEMILATEKYYDKDERVRKDAHAKLQGALDQLLVMQRDDFYGILKAMRDLPVTIRLLDPPLHEFLPAREKIMDELRETSMNEENLKVIDAKIKLYEIVKQLHEINPMLGHRGCRLALTYPEIAEMQIRAIFEAACQLEKEKIHVKPEIMIPVVCHVNEFNPLKELTHKVAKEIMDKTGVKVHYMVGTMIELPRACVTADEIAKEAEFFSFGTNDLTQTTLGFSRDDAERKFIGIYIDKKILSVNPFEVLDRNGVGELMKIAVAKGKSARPTIQLGICGEHGGEPNSVEFCYELGLNYVSCSPKRVPVARLAAALSRLKNESCDAPKAEKKSKSASK